MIQRTSHEQLTGLLKRMAFLPGYDRLTKEAVAEYARLLCPYFPHELERAVNEILASPKTEFFPPPGRIVEVMGRHRSLLGRDWDTVEAGLLMEAGGETPSGYIEPVKDRAQLEAGAREFFNANPGLLR